MTYWLTLGNLFTSPKLIVDRYNTILINGKPLLMLIFNLQYNIRPQSIWNGVHISSHNIFLWSCSPTGVMASSFTKFLYYTHNDTPQSVGLLWTSDQLVAETSTWKDTTLTTDIYMSPAGFEPTISADERPQTYALDGAANGTGLPIILQPCFKH